ncbi:MAG: hypothetical protein IT537_04670 [Hyphomicrobiales bacterium]|nr:hypothetical protein [Hyphomicrobiales bacterium]
MNAPRSGLWGLGAEQPLPGLFGDLTVEDAMRLINQQYAPMTAATRAGMRNGEMRAAPTEADDIQRRLDYGALPAKLAVEIAKQPYHAGVAMSEAAIDPSIANLTNAGVQTAMMVPTLRGAQAAIGVLGAGYGTAAVKDSGLLDIGAAHAQGAKLTKAQERALEIERQREDTKLRGQEQANEIARKDTEERKRIERGDAKAAAEHAEYERAVQRAEAAAAKARAGDDRFANSTLKEVYQKTGGPIPLAAAAAGTVGALHRAAPGLQKWLEGTGAAFTVNNAPIGYDAIMAPVVNPEYEAVSAMARELPATHPDKQRYVDLEQRMRERGQVNNPVRAKAWEEFTDPVLMAKRLGMSGIEGLSANIGAAIPGAVSDAGRAAGRGMKSAAGTIAEVPGAVVAGHRRGMSEAADAGVMRAQAEGKLLTANEALQGARASADGARASADELARRSGGQTGGPGPAAGPAQMSDDALAYLERSRAGGQRPAAGSPEVVTGQTSPNPIVPQGNNPTLPVQRQGDLPGLFAGPVEHTIARPAWLDELTTALRPTQPPPAPPRQPPPPGDKLPPNPPPPPGLVIPPGMKGSQTWGNESSDAARHEVNHWLAQGGNLGKGNAQALNATKLHEVIPTSKSVSHTQAAVKRLRDVLVANGIDPAKATAKQVEQVLKQLPKELFAVPAIGAGLWGALDQPDSQPTGLFQ